MVDENEKQEDPTKKIVVIQPDNMTVKVRDLTYGPRKEEESDGKVV